MTTIARLASSGRRAMSVMRRRDWALVAAAVIIGTLLALTLLVAQVDAYRARSLAAEQAQAQASIVADQRAAQSRRIDQLTAQLDVTRDQLRAQAKVVGRQEQAIRDLAAQVDQLGGEPVTASVSANRTATRTAQPTASPTEQPSRRSSSATTSEPKPGPATPTTTPAPSPTGTPHQDDGPLGICALLPLC